MLHKTTRTQLTENLKMFFEEFLHVLNIVRGAGENTSKVSV
jgi:hypothetical protein